MAVDEAHGVSVGRRLRRRGAGRAAPARSTRPGSAAWRAPGQLVEDRRAAVAVGAVRVGVAELGEDARRGARHERRDGQPDEPARLDEVAEDAAQALAGRRRRRPSRPWPGPTAARRRRPCWRRRRTPTARPGRRAGGRPRAAPRTRRQRLAPSRRPSGDVARPARGAGRSPSR